MARTAKPVQNISPPSHTATLKRLARIGGQIEGIKRMIEDNRYCPDILTQTAAVRAAVKAVESEVLQRHIAHCVQHAFTNGEDAKPKIDELLEIFKKQAG